LDFVFIKKEKKGKIIDYLPMVEFPPMPVIFPLILPLILPLIIVPLPVMLLLLVLSIVAFWVTSLDPDFDSDPDPDAEACSDPAEVVQTTLSLPFGATHVPVG
jgi:hypothetical protein